jgi:hypothetical protein
MPPETSPSLLGALVCLLVQQVLCKKIPSSRFLCYIRLRQTLVVVDALPHPRKSARSLWPPGPG